MGSKFLCKLLRVPKSGYISQSLTKHNGRLLSATTVAQSLSLPNSHDLFRLQPISTVSNDNINSTSTQPQGKPKMASSLKDIELSKFSAIADTWWDSEGPFKPLHAMNPTRLAFIRSTLCRHFRKDPLWPRPLEGLKILDVGCGGGILSEPLARMGAAVTGVDAVEKNIKIARLHAVCSYYFIKMLFIFVYRCLC
uniref:Hexaprenyldihydroxybenzoate methyltransferase n=1 Tax=Rhizophora mucronata TaxID=61149 RepID=A0A2P2K3V6_RHIMU